MTLPPQIKSLCLDSRGRFLEAIHESLYDVPRRFNTRTVRVNVDSVESPTYI